MVKRRMGEVGSREPSEHVFLPPSDPLHHSPFRKRDFGRLGKRCRTWEPDMIANDVVPDVGKGSEHATNVAEGRQPPSPLTGPSLGLSLEIDEQKDTVGPSSQDLRQVQVRVDDALHPAHVALEMPKAFLDRCTKLEELGSCHAGGFREHGFVGTGEVTQSAKSGSEGSGRRFEHVAEILVGEGLRMPESWMAVDEGFMQGRRGPSEIGGEMATRLIKILVRADLPTQGLTPTVAEPGEQVVRIDVLRRYGEHEAVRPTPESDLAEQPGHMRELAGVESSQNVGFPVPCVEELVRFQDDVSRSGRNPEDDIRGVAAGNQRGSTKDAYVLPVETQRVPRFGRDLRPSSEGIHREAGEGLPALRFHHVESVVVRLEFERGRIESSRRDGEGEV